MLVNRGCPADADHPGVTLFDGVTFAGAGRRSRATWRSSAPPGLNDRISSLAIAPGLVVTLYADASFQGTCKSFAANNADLRTTRFGNDIASSLRMKTTSACSGGV